MSLHYTIVLKREPDGSAINVRVPALPGVFTWGSTEEEAIASAKEAISLHLEGYRERGLPYPPDRVARMKRASLPRAVPRTLSRRVNQTMRRLPGRTPHAIRIVDVSPAQSSMEAGAA
ncbi:MAG: type II toxin-antitoxin system HicB family antitoxin [Thermomicrobiales bacterium]|nr:type II toxin-antitoxin system HicB family antitoxin [Thermomicrobiales bacterium]